MILLSNMADVYRWGGREGVGYLLGRRSDGRRRGWGGFRSKLHSNKRRSLGLDWSLYEVGTSPPHDLDITHGLVASNTHTHQKLSYIFFVFGTFYLNSVILLVLCLVLLNDLFHLFRRYF